MQRHDGLFLRATRDGSPYNAAADRSSRRSLVNFRGTSPRARVRPQRPVSTAAGSMRAALRAGSAAPSTQKPMAKPSASATSSGPNTK